MFVVGEVWKEHFGFGTWMLIANGLRGFKNLTYPFQKEWLNRWHHSTNSCLFLFYHMDFPDSRISQVSYLHTLLIKDTTYKWVFLKRHPLKWIPIQINLMSFLNSCPVRCKFIQVLKFRSFCFILMTSPRDQRQGRNQKAWNSCF